MFIFMCRKLGKTLNYLLISKEEIMIDRGHKPRFPKQLISGDNMHETLDQAHHRSCNLAS